MNIDMMLTKNLLPDPVIRYGIRKLLKERLAGEQKANAEEQQKSFMELIDFLKNSPIAVNTSEANEQHYEVPAKFFKTALGNRLKYSCGYWDEDTKNLDEAELKMLDLTCKRAGVKNNEEILELGCGWGSLTLYMAENFPQSRITAVSNSRTQKEYIDDEAARRGLTNINVITADMNEFTTSNKFDRIVSVEMFEHMRNYSVLFDKVNSWLKPGGELFVHIFAHNKYAYLFEVKDSSDWMSKYFFTGGIMPSDKLLLYFAGNFEIKNHWIVNGEHYEKTANAWLENIDNSKEEVLQLFSSTYGEKDKLKWFIYWRVFFMSCAELWGFNNGEEWFVSHYLFKKR